MKHTVLLFTLLILFVSPAYACHPTLLCVDNLNEGSYKAHFGYVGQENFIAIGAQNKFTGNPSINQNQGQGTDFSSTLILDHVRVSFLGSTTVSWTLNGVTVTASSNSIKCTQPTATVTSTPTKTATYTATATRTFTPGYTPTICIERSPTPESSPTSEPTNTPKATSTPINTPTIELPTLPTSTPIVIPTAPPAIAIPHSCPLVDTGIDKERLLLFASKLKNKSVKYFTQSGLCGNRKFKSQVSKTLSEYKTFQKEVEAFPVNVELCGTSCVQVVTQEFVNKLHETATNIYKLAIKSQSYGNICHEKGNGIKHTRPIVNKFNKIVDTCPSSVCP